MDLKLEMKLEFLLVLDNPPSKYFIYRVPGMDWLYFRLFTEIRRGFRLVSGAYSQHIFLWIFSLYNTSLIDQVSILTFFTSPDVKQYVFLKFLFRLMIISFPYNSSNGQQKKSTKIWISQERKISQEYLKSFFRKI